MKIHCIWDNWVANNKLLGWDIIIHNRPSTTDTEGEDHSWRSYPWDPLCSITGNPIAEGGANMEHDCHNFYLFPWTYSIIILVKTSHEEKPWKPSERKRDTVCPWNLGLNRRADTEINNVYACIWEHLFFC